MNKRLYKFLKSKGCEFCYKDKEPFLLDNTIPSEWLTEYTNVLKKNDLCQDVSGSLLILKAKIAAGVYLKYHDELKLSLADCDNVIGFIVDECMT